jgi:hypothetical protein
MAPEISGTARNSLVHRFITSGKPGKCELCPAFVKKLEAHHIKYSPEITIKLCHLCHHKAHFWPNRLTAPQKYKILSKVHPPALAHELAELKHADIQELARIIAPSRSAFIHAAQKLEEKRVMEGRPDVKFESASKKAIREIPRLSHK